MATTLEQIQEFLDEFDLRYGMDEERNAVLIGFNLDRNETTYRDREGDAHVGLVIRLLEDGDFLGIFAPFAWSVHRCPHQAAVFEALAAIQAKYKMLRFDYDAADGEIRPNVELALEDSTLTSRQFHRLMHTMMDGIQRFDGVIRHAMETGEVSFASVQDDERTAGSSPEIVRMQELATEAGGLEALERVACGWHVEETDAEPAAAGDRPVDAVAPVGAVEPADAAAPPALKPVIRRLWERLFGRVEPDSGTRRRAG